MRVSVVVDCADPVALAPFWATALRYVQVWTGGEHGDDQFAVLQPAEGEPPGPVLILQKVPEPRTGKNRAHLDVHAEDLSAHVARLESLGATCAGERIDELGHRWQRMQDPEGNEFCVVDASNP